MLAYSKRFSVLLSLLLFCTITSGCNYLVIFGYLIGGPPSVEPEFDKETKESMTDKDVRVVVVCFAPNEINEFTLYEEGSPNLYRGRAECIVSVWKMDDDNHAEKIFSSQKISKYPLHQPVSSGDKTYITFKGEYLTRLSDEIGRFFYEYYIADEIASGGG